MYGADRAGRLVMHNLDLEHFAPEEFREWWPLMHLRLLVLLDVLRHMHGAPIRVSAHPAALGRRLGAGGQSEHNVDHWGDVRAVDCFAAGVRTTDQAAVFVTLASEVGFTGIGVYADTTNNDGVEQVMFHLGVRNTERMGAPATWGRVAGRYTTITEALHALPEE